jgi:DNA-binding NtrC family response regulator
LRERRSEIPALVNYYVNHYANKFGRNDVQITPQAVDLLMVNDWPGNIRQLCNELQRAVARAEDGTVITPDQLSPELSRVSAPPSTQESQAVTPATYAAPPDTLPPNVTLADAVANAVENMERHIITETLRQHNGNVTRAARALGITRRGLQLKLSRYNIAATA